MQKPKIEVMMFLIVLFSVTPSICYGLDTDLYVLSGVNIPPNVLIILDSSASMSEVSSGQNYDPAIDYSLYGPGTVYPSDEVYYKSGNNWFDTTYTTSTLQCSDLVTNYLLPLGQAINYTGCGYKNKTFQTGNFMNYLQLTGGPGGNRPRFGLANGILHSYIDTTSGIRFAVMAFNRDTNGYTVKDNNGAEYVFGDSQDSGLDAKGGQLLGFVDENKNGKTALFNTLAVFKNDSWSPLAETLYEAGAYFQGKKSVITGTHYGGQSPVKYSCQKNYVLIISDGIPTKDNDSLLRTQAGINDKDGDGQLLDEVAEYLYGLDLSDGNAIQKQNIRTYTIGFSITQTLLENTATKGGGKYFYVWSSQSFDIAFQTFIAEVLQDSVSYVAPVVPISQMQQTSAGDHMYLAMFKPTETSFWKGNIKKYCIAKKDASGQVVDCSGKAAAASVGDMLDVNGSPVVDSKNQIVKDAKSFWSSAVDGGNTDAGGIGEKLLARDLSTRKIYTYLGTKVDLIDPTDHSNDFSKSNTAITPQTLGLSAGDTNGRNKVIDFVYGYDAYYQNQFPPQGPSAKRDWILGAFIHSRPVVIPYGNRTVVFAGANDGMLHAFDDATGQELWAFIPPNLLPNLKNLNGQALQFFVDGAPKAFITTDASNSIVSATLLFGERRGGNHYMALDITSPLSPKFLWEIGPSGITYQTTVTNTTAYQELGETWATPSIGKIRYGSGEKWVAFIGGGYDENQDNQPVINSDTTGRAIYAVDISNGSLIWSYSRAKDATMNYSIPSDVVRVDTNGDGFIDRLYVGDTGGRIWRFDIKDPNSTNWSGKTIFNSNAAGNSGRKIFYPPDVTLEKGNYEMIFFGTGDREHPKDISNVDRLYAIKDQNPSQPLTEANLYDASEDLIQTGTTTQQSAALAQLNASSGWLIKLDQNSGEKCLANSVIFFGAVYYTTFQPVFGQQNDICFLNAGKARLYGVNYKTGAAVFDLDGLLTSDTLGRSDRSVQIGTSIPSGVIITFIGGATVAYGGMGGGVYRPPLPTTKTLFPTSWRIVF